MKDASSYPITTGYGYIPGYPLNNGYHRGEDRIMPNDTPVIVNGVQIGLSNNTGASTGSHLHIGRFVNGTDTAPQGGGFKFNSAIVYDTGSDAINGNFVRLTADGAIWVYLHLQRIDVKAGQVLKGGIMDKITKAQEQVCSIMQTGSKPGSNYDYRFTGLPLTQANLDAMLNFWQAQKRPNASILKTGLYEVK